MTKNDYLCTMFKRKVQRFIEEKRLFTLKDKVLVALSGGADSVALLRVLLDLGYPCEVAHCNFHLRGEESNRDEHFVRTLCEALHIPLHITHFDTTHYASTHHISIEMAARELRYTWFESIRKERGAEVIAVAHHRDDSVETLLLNLVRGTGINGLKGITPKNGHIVRPLLNVSREEVMDYLFHLHQDYVTDSTNLQDEYMRNKLRLNVLPLLRELNPSVNESIAETANRLTDVAHIYNKVMEQARLRIVCDDHRVHIPSLLREDVPETLLFEVLRPYGFHSPQVRDIFRSLSAQSGKRFSSGKWEVLRDREYLLIRLLDVEEQLPNLEMKELELTPDFIIPRDKEVACLDADTLALPLTVRKWQKGDKFIPFGMKGSKNVSDYLTDRKFSLFAKENQYVVCDAEGRIVWLVNERSDNRFRITGKTKRVIELKITKKA